MPITIATARQPGYAAASGNLQRVSRAARTTASIAGPLPATQQGPRGTHGNQRADDLPGHDQPDDPTAGTRMKGLFKHARKQSGRSRLRQLCDVKTPRTSASTRSITPKDLENRPQLSNLDSHVCGLRWLRNWRYGRGDPRRWGASPGTRSDRRRREAPPFVPNGRFRKGIWHANCHESRQESARVDRLIEGDAGRWNIR